MRLKTIGVDVEDGAWAMERGRFEALAARLARITPAELAKARADYHERGGPPVRAPYVMHGSTAEIRVSGVLMKSVPWIYEFFGIEATSTVALRSAVERAAADKGVEAIALRIDSPGGQVGGTLEAGDAIFAAAKSKRVCAFVEGMAASAAYWLASQANEISSTEDSYVGSIGVYQVWEDDSEAAAKAGVKVHVVRSGELKGMGEPGSPITDAQLAMAQELVDGLCKMFVSAVSRGRGRAEGADKDTDYSALATGQVWLAKDAKKQGLVDRIEPAGVGFARMRSEVDMDEKKAAEEKAKAMAEAQAAERKRFADLRSAFPDDPAFASAQYEIGATVEQASVAYVPVLREKLKAQAAAKPAPVPALPAGPAGAPPLRSSGDPASTGTVEKGLAGWAKRARALAKEEGISFSLAMSKLARQDPAGHQQAIREDQKVHSTIKSDLAFALEHGASELRLRARQ